MRLRRLHRWYARWAGFFWLPCPLCGQEFGGHEWRDINGKMASIPDPAHADDPPGSPERAIGICPDCTAAGLGWSRWIRQIT